MYAVPLDQLPPHLLALWREMLEDAGPDIGPFLHPEFVRAVAAVRPNIEVGVLEDAGEIGGFLPYQRGPWGIARPVAGRLCDQAGAVLRAGSSWQPRAFARAVDLRAIRLANAPVGDPALAPFQDRPRRIRFLDMSAGFETYRKQNLASGSRFIRQIESRVRKAEAQLGPMRFEWHTDDDAVIGTLLAWKAAQRRQSGTPNIFDLPWARGLVERLRRIHVDGFEGVLSAVWFGDTLAAAHFGIRSASVLQYWVPGYNAAFARYSPGLACLLAVAKEAANRGVVRVDLGVGEQRFKLQAADGVREVATATVRRDPAVGALLTTLDGVRSWARESPGRDWMHRASRALARGSYRARSLLR